MTQATTSSASVTRDLRRRVPAVLVGLTFSLTLIYCVKHFVAVPFRYMGYVERPWVLSEVIVALLANLLLVALAGSRIDSAGRGALAFLVAFVGSPVIWLPVFYGVLEQQSLTTLSIMVVICFAVTRATLEFLPVPELPTLSGRIPAVALLVVAALLGLVFIVMTTGLSLNWVSLADVYDQRDEYSDVATPAVAYSVGWVGSGILPVLAALGVHRRSPALLATGFGGLAAIYMLAGFKSYLLGALLVFAVSLGVGRRKHFPSWMVYAGTAGAVVVAMVADRVSGTLIFTSLGVRRAFATAGINTAYFLDFFSDHPTYQLRHSALSSLGDAPYSVTPARLIGLTYYGSSETAANANYLADGMANFGLPGMIAAAFVVGLWLKLVDTASRDLPVAVSFAAVVIVLVTFSNTASLTVLATHGGAMILVSLWLLSDAARHEKTPPGSTPDMSRADSRSPRVLEELS